MRISASVSSVELRSNVIPNSLSLHTLLSAFIEFNFTFVFVTYRSVSGSSSSFAVVDFLFRYEQHAPLSLLC